MQILDAIAPHYNYAVTIFLMISGLYIVIARGNMVKKAGWPVAVSNICLSALHLSRQNHVGGTAPIIDESLYGLFQSRCPMS